MRTLIGRSAAARVIRRRSSGERRVVPGWRRSGPLILRASRRGPHADPSADLEPERLGGAALVYGEAQPPVGVRDEHELASPGGSKGLEVAYRHLAVAHVDAEGGTVLELRFLLGYGQAGVAVAVYGDDPCRDTLTRAPLDDTRYAEAHQGGWFRGLSQLRELQSRREVRRHRREDVATVEGVRDGVDVIALVGEHYHLRNATQSLSSRGEQAVIRPDQQGPALRPQRERPPIRTNSRIDDREVDRVIWHVASRVLQDLRPGLDLESRHLVSKIHDRYPGRDAQHHTLARADEVVGEPEVGEEADGPHAGKYKADRPPCDPTSDNASAERSPPKRRCRPPHNPRPAAIQALHS